MSSKIKINIEISSHLLKRALNYVGENVSLDRFIEIALQNSIMRREENDDREKD